VWGLGTRAVERVGNDYPRLIALSHPMLRPSTDPKAIRRYSQQYVDLIDLEDNTFKTLPAAEVLSGNYEPLRYIAQVEEDGYISSLRTRYIEGGNSRLVITFDELLRRTPFAERMRDILYILEQQYQAPIDLEFTVSVHEGSQGQPDLCITILQCRPQSQLQVAAAASLPEHLQSSDIVFQTRFVVPEGYLPRVDYILFVPPEAYFKLPNMALRTDLARLVGRLNSALEGEKFICVGPGRWGSTNTDLGVPIDYGDIYNARALVELAGQGIGLPPEPSLGTHFFQDLLEAQIYPLAIHLDDNKNIFNRVLFYGTPNRACERIDVPDELKDALRLIRITDFRPEHHMEVVMSDEKGIAIAFLRAEESD